MNFKPTGNYILIEKPETSDTTPGGMFIPESALERSSVAQVIAVGPGTLDSPMFVKPGDKVMLTKFLGYDITIDGQSHTLITQDNVISLYEEINEKV